MASQVEICNRALTKNGAGRITSLSDDNVRASVMSAIWDSVRKAELRKAFWSFAMARARLPKLVEAPAFGYNNQFQLPSDFLRVVKVGDWYDVPAIWNYVNGDTSVYAIEGGKILCDFAAPLNLRYIRDETDPGTFDPLFVEAFATRLAAESCEELTNSNSRKQALQEEYRLIMGKAVAVGAIERPPVAIADDSWVISRIM